MPCVWWQLAIAEIWLTWSLVRDRCPGRESQAARVNHQARRRLFRDQWSHVAHLHPVLLCHPGLHPLQAAHVIRTFQPVHTQRPADGYCCESWQCWHSGFVVLVYQVEVSNAMCYICLFGQSCRQWVCGFQASPASGVGLQLLEPILPSECKAAPSKLPLAMLVT